MSHCKALAEEFYNNAEYKQNFPEDNTPTPVSGRGEFVSVLKKMYQNSLTAM